ncbi:hypothetical protein Z046_30910 [Pseudomonas aeruginosa VRFPA09]|nr:hypothetical protein Z046_30910 [Pseudomonas aeruginosa VRFPA09]
MIPDITKQLGNERESRLRILLARTIYEAIFQALGDGLIWITMVNRSKLDHTVIFSAVGHCARLGRARRNDAHCTG